MTTWEDGTPKSTGNAFDLSDKRRSMFYDRFAQRTLNRIAAKDIAAGHDVTPIYGLSRKSDEATRAYRTKQKNAKTKAT